MRKRWKKEEIKELLSRWERYSEGLGSFLDEEGITRSQFYYLKKKGDHKDHSGPRLFKEVPILRSNACSREIIVENKSGLKVRVSLAFDDSELKRIFSCLSE